MVAAAVGSFAPLPEILSCAISADGAFQFDGSDIQGVSSACSCFLSTGPIQRTFNRQISLIPVQLKRPARQIDSEKTTAVITLPEI